MHVVTYSDPECTENRNSSVFVPCSSLIFTYLLKCTITDYIIYEVFLEMHMEDYSNMYRVRALVKRL
jgi:hypothetical protein